MLQEEIANPNPNFQINQANPGDFGPPVRGGLDGISRPPVVNRREILRHTYYHFILFVP